MILPDAAKAFCRFVVMVQATLTFLAWEREDVFRILPVSYRAVQT